VFLTVWRCLCIQGRFCSGWLPSGRRNVGGLGSLFEMQNHVLALLQGVQCDFKRMKSVGVPAL
jgi:hypothetical protein